MIDLRRWGRAPSLKRLRPPDLQVLMDDILMQGDRAVYHWTLIGTNAGPGGTGRRVRIMGFEVWKIGEDGLIAESQGHFDSAVYQRQLEQRVTDPQQRRVLAFRSAMRKFRTPDLDP
jgi:hypothetical protein